MIDNCVFLVTCFPHTSAYVLYQSTHGRPRLNYMERLTGMKTDELVEWHEAWRELCEVCFRHSDVYVLLYYCMSSLLIKVPVLCCDVICRTWIVWLTSHIQRTTVNYPVVDLMRWRTSTAVHLSVCLSVCDWCYQSEHIAVSTVLMSFFVLLVILASETSLFADVRCLFWCIHVCCKQVMCCWLIIGWGIQSVAVSLIVQYR